MLVSFEFILKNTRCVWQPQKWVFLLETTFLGALGVLFCDELVGGLSVLLGTDPVAPTCSIRPMGPGLAERVRRGSPTS